MLHFGVLTASTNLIRIVQQVQPYEIYNLGTFMSLEAIRILELTETTRIYQDSTNELYGLVQEVHHSEQAIVQIAPIMWIGCITA